MVTPHFLGCSTHFTRLPLILKGPDSNFGVELHTRGVLPDFGRSLGGVKDQIYGITPPKHTLFGRSVPHFQDLSPF